MSPSLDPVSRAWLSLEGLAVGDAFGERFFIEPKTATARIAQRTLDTYRPWRWTDDTAMARTLVASLEENGGLDHDAYATALLEQYRHEPWRGYGGGMHNLFGDMERGATWKDAAAALFDGAGSYGNGAAMRAAPLGAFYADDLDTLVDAARRSAMITHAHPEGQAGAVAVAVAGAVAWSLREKDDGSYGERLFAEVLARTPAGPTRDGIEAARDLPLTEDVDAAVARLGNGSGSSSQDTVPLCLWCTARHPYSYEEALWTTVQALGDRDTTCAIVGSVVVLSAAPDTLPREWMEAREPMAGIPLSDDAPAPHGP